MEVEVGVVCVVFMATLLNGKKKLLSVSDLIITKCNSVVKSLHAVL